MPMTRIRMMMTLRLIMKMMRPVWILTGIALKTKANMAIILMLELSITLLTLKTMLGNLKKNSDIPCSQQSKL